MTSKLAAVSLSLIMPFAGRLPPQPRALPADTPTRAERFAGSAVAYAACGLPPLVIAGLAAMYGWTAPLVLAFAAGGAALSLVEGDAQFPALQAVAGAVRGAVLFPVMTAFAGQRAWGPLLAKELHRWRHRAGPQF